MPRFTLPAQTTAGRRSKAMGLIAALSVAGLLAAGCSGSSPTPAPAPSPATSASSVPTSAPPTTAPSSASSTPTAASPSESSGGATSSTPASTAVPAPTPGSVESTVPPRTVPTKSPVKINKPATVSDAKVQISGQKAITSKAQGPGEVSGPAVALTFTITNTGTRKLDLSSVVINVADSKGNPASQMSASPARPFDGTVAAGKKSTGVYVYNIAKSARGKIRIEVSVNPELPTAVFVGKAI